MKKRTKKIIRTTGFFLFLVYLFLLAYYLFFSEDYGRVVDADRGYRYNLVPFMEIHRFLQYRDEVGWLSMFTNVFGNVLGLIPFGFIVPMIWRDMKNGFLITLSGFCFSLTIETIQLVTRVGCFDVDDLILNTLGVVIGYGMFLICDNLRRRHYGKKI